VVFFAKFLALGDLRLALLSGESGYGNESVLLTLEECQQPYLLWVRQLRDVQSLVAQRLTGQDWCRPNIQGFQKVQA
jgi:hypothetical protein